MTQRSSTDRAKKLLGSWLLMPEASSVDITSGMIGQAGIMNDRKLCVALK